MKRINLLTGPYVRATLVHAGSGRKVDTARTDPQEPSANPEFCETLSLKLTPAQMGTLSLVVALCHRLPVSDEEFDALFIVYGPNHLSLMKQSNLAREM